VSIAERRRDLALPPTQHSFNRMADIVNEADVRTLVDAFYASIQKDDLLNPIFSDVAKVDWSHHLPRMYAFWNGLILGIPGYTGAPFPPHTVLPVSREHFVRWLELFHATVDAHFAGEKAQRAKDAASSIAHTFAMRMGLIDPMAGRML
jgi:hemoglobin